MKAKVTTAILLLIGVMPPIFAQEDQCGIVEFRDVIERTESEVVERVSLLDIIANPYDLLSGIDSACVLLRFDISHDGIAEDIRPVRFEPDRVLIRAAVRALKKYKFCPSEAPDKREGMLIFQLRLEDLASKRKLD